MSSADVTRASSTDTPMVRTSPKAPPSRFQKRHTCHEATSPDRLQGLQKGPEGCSRAKAPGDTQPPNANQSLPSLLPKEPRTASASLGPEAPSQRGRSLASHAAPRPRLCSLMEHAWVAPAQGTLFPLGSPRYCPSPDGSPCLSSWLPPHAPSAVTWVLPSLACYFIPAPPATPSPGLSAELGTQKGSAQHAGPSASLTPAARTLPPRALPRAAGEPRP